MTCRYAGPGLPRILPRRHDADCWTDACEGCAPCPESHCRVCGRVHAEWTCAECVAEARSDLTDIARMCDVLPEEAEHRGIEGEAMMLLGPTADVEARQHVEASYLAGRLPEGWIEASHGKGCPILRNEACVGCAGDERHPLAVLASWQDVYAAEFDHELTARATVADAAGYLRRNLTYAATWPHAPFEDFARDLRRCRAHLESVLHDGEQVDTGAPCMTCGTTLERTWGTEPKHDGWRCPRCRQTSTEDQYRFAVMHLHREEADWLTDRDMEIRTGIKATTVRSWARSDLVARHLDTGRVVYAVADVEQVARDKGMIA